MSIVQSVNSVGSKKNPSFFGILPSAHQFCAFVLSDFNVLCRLLLCGFIYEGSNVGAGV